MKSLVLCVLAGLANVSLTTVSRAADGWGGSVALTSDYVLRGVSQSNGQAAAQLDLHYELPAGFVAGIWASTIKLNPAGPTTAEIDPFIGYRWLAGNDWSAKLTAVHYAYPWNMPDAHYDYDEIIAGLAYSDLLYATVAYSPNTSLYTVRGLVRDRSALSYDVVLQKPLVKRLSGSVGLGYYDVRELLGKGYGYWNAGLLLDLAPIQLSVSYIGIGAVPDTLLYRAGLRNRWTASLIWRF